MQKLSKTRQMSIRKSDKRGVKRSKTGWVFYRNLNHKKSNFGILYGSLRLLQPGCRALLRVLSRRIKILLRFSMAYKVFGPTLFWLSRLAKKHSSFFCPLFTFQIWQKQIDFLKRKHWIQRITSKFWIQNTTFISKTISLFTWISRVKTFYEFSTYFW